MQTHPTHAIDRSVDPDQLDRHIAEMYRDVANEMARELHFPIGRALAEALGYPTELLDRLPAEAVASFAGGGYPLGLAHLLPGERVLGLGSGSGTDVFAAGVQVGPRGSVAGLEVQLVQRNPSYRFTSERAQRTGAKYGASSISLLALNPHPTMTQEVSQ